MNININPPHFFPLSVLLMIFLNCLSSPCRIDILEVFLVDFFDKIKYFYCIAGETNQIAPIKS